MPSADEALDFEPDTLASIPPRVRPLVNLLRAMPAPLAREVLAGLAIADGALRGRRLATARRWARALGRTGWAEWRLALAVLENHGRFVAQEMMLGDVALSSIKARTTLVGAEHLDELQGGALILGSHIGPPRSWLALSACGYHVRAARRMEYVVRTAAFDDLEAREVVVRFQDGAAEDRVQALYRLRRLAAGGALIYITADGPFGREAFRIELPGGPFIARQGWLALRRHARVPTIPVLAHMERGRRIIELHPPLPPPHDDPARDAEQCREVLAPLLHDYVRRYPEQCRYLVLPPWN